MTKMTGSEESQAVTLPFNVTSDVTGNGSREWDYGAGMSIWWILYYMQPSICVFGFLGNTLSLLVFVSKKMRVVSSNVYLAGLSASNSAFLLALFVVWLESVNVRVVHENGWCQAVIYITYVSSFLSVWLIVCITIENYIITFYLHEAARFCTVPRALVVLFSLLFFALLLYDFAIWSSQSVITNNRPLCDVPLAYEKIITAFTYVDVTVTLIIPTIIILVLVVAIFIHNLSRARSRAALARRTLSRKERTLLRITRLLLVIAVSFLVLTGPSQVNKLRHLVMGLMEANGRATHQDNVVQFWFNLFYYAAFGCNFVYYLIWGKNFRSYFSKLLKGMHKSCRSSHGFCRQQ